MTEQKKGGWGFFGGGGGGKTDQLSSDVIGELVLTVMNAKLLRNTELVGKMDPYVSIEYKKKKYKTDVDNDGGMTPVWNNQLIIPIQSLEDDLKVSCFDEDLITDDLVGQALIKVSKIIQNKNREFNLPIYIKVEHAGDIKMVATFDQTRLKQKNDNPSTLTLGNDFINQQRGDEQTVNNQWGPDNAVAKKGPKKKGEKISKNKNVDDDLFDEGQEEVGELPKNNKHSRGKINEKNNGGISQSINDMKMSLISKQDSMVNISNNVSSTNSASNGVGQLEIKIIRGLLYKNTEMFGKMDPFIQIEYNKIKIKTPTIDEGGETPVWDYTFTLDIITMTEEDHITFVCLEEDFLKNDYIGETTLKVRYMKEQSGKQIWVPFYEKDVKTADILMKPKFTAYNKGLTSQESFKSQITGSISLNNVGNSRQLTMQQQSSLGGGGSINNPSKQLKAVNDMQTGVLEAKIMDGKINRQKVQVQNSTLIKIYYNSNYYRTRPSTTQKDVYLPVWNHQFNIPIYAQQTQINITMVSCDDNSTLAESLVSSSQLIDMSKLGSAQWLQLVNQQGDVTATIQVLMRFRIGSIIGGSVEMGKASVSPQFAKSRQIRE